MRSRLGYTATMIEIHKAADFPEKLRGGVLCVGNFDGVHLGHARMLSTGREEATRRGRPFTIMTFDPHPAVILKPATTRHPLTTALQRRELLTGFSPDVLLVVPTTREFLSITAEDFLAQVVAGAMGATLMVEGPTFTFGRGAKGTPATLAAEGARFGFETLIVPTQEQSLMDLTLVNVSSSVIRWLIQQGRVADAARCLGRPYALRGTVIQGARRGREIGFPTANLKTEQLIPAPGVYAGKAGAGGREYRAAISIGDNPTFPGSPSTVEAYLLDFDADLYGQTIDIAFHWYLRDMYAFGGVEPLVKQIALDVEQTRRLISA